MMHAGSASDEAVRVPPPPGSDPSGQWPRVGGICLEFGCSPAAGAEVVRSSARKGASCPDSDHILQTPRRLFCSQI